MNIPSFSEVRPADRTDLPELLQMMRELAAFEGYLSDFAVTELELQRRGFPDGGVPEFFSLIATDRSGKLAGYLVAYIIPFTYDLKPTLVIKELFVRAERRREGFGWRLLEEIEKSARARGCGLLTWAVLPGNDRAEKLYRAWGGEPDARWNYWRRKVNLPE